MSDAELRQLEQENAQLMTSVRTLREKVQYLVDNHCEEHKCDVFVFPDGSEWKKS